MVRKGLLKAFRRRSSTTVIDEVDGMETMSIAELLDLLDYRRYSDEVRMDALWMIDTKVIMMDYECGLCVLSMLLLTVDRGVSDPKENVKKTSRTIAMSLLGLTDNGVVDEVAATDSKAEKYREEMKEGLKMLLLNPDFPWKGYAGDLLLMLVSPGDEATAEWLIKLAYTNTMACRWALYALGRVVVIGSASHIKLIPKLIQLIGDMQQRYANDDSPERDSVVSGMLWKLSHQLLTKVQVLNYKSNRLKIPIQQKPGTDEVDIPPLWAMCADVCFSTSSGGKDKRLGAAKTVVQERRARLKQESAEWEHGQHGTSKETEEVDVMDDASSGEAQQQQQQQQQPMQWQCKTCSHPIQGWYIWGRERSSIKATGSFSKLGLSNAALGKTEASGVTRTNSAKQSLLAATLDESVRQPHYIHHACCPVHHPEAFNQIEIVAAPLPLPLEVLEEEDTPPRQTVRQNGYLYAVGDKPGELIALRPLRNQEVWIDTEGNLASTA